MSEELVFDLNSEAPDSVLNSTKSNKGSEPIVSTSHSSEFDLRLEFSRARHNQQFSASKWQKKVIATINEALGLFHPALESLSKIQEEFTYEIIEGKTGIKEKLLDMWLMTIKLASDKVSYPRKIDKKDIIRWADDLWKTFSHLADAAILNLREHKDTYKTDIHKLEACYDKFFKYFNMVGMPVADLKSAAPEIESNKIVDIMKSTDEPILKVTPTPVIPDRFVDGAYTVSITVLHREIFLVHDQDRNPNPQMLRLNGVDFPRDTELLGTFVDHIIGMLKRNLEQIHNFEVVIHTCITRFCRRLKALNKSLERYRRAFRLKRSSCSDPLKEAMTRLHDEVGTFIEEVVEMKLVYMRILSAGESCLNSITKYWTNFDGGYGLLIQKYMVQTGKKMPWWHPKRLREKTISPFWTEIYNDVSKFEYDYKCWGREHMHLINLRLSISPDLGQLIFSDFEGYTIPSLHVYHDSSYDDQLNTDSVYSTATDDEQFEDDDEESEANEESEAENPFTIPPSRSEIDFAEQGSSKNVRTQMSISMKDYDHSLASLKNSNMNEKSAITIATLAGWPGLPPNCSILSEAVSFITGSDSDNDGSSSSSSSNSDVSDSVSSTSSSSTTS